MKHISLRGGGRNFLVCFSDDIADAADKTSSEFLDAICLFVCLFFCKKSCSEIIEPLHNVTVEKQNLPFVPDLFRLKKDYKK